MLLVVVVTGVGVVPPVPAAFATAALASTIPLPQLLQVAGNARVVVFKIDST